MIKIHNIRLGHACNSSSSHSMVFLTEEELKGIKDDIVYDGKNGPNFGWEFFTCLSKENKALYLASQLFYSIRYELGDAIAKAVIKDWLGVSFDNGLELGTVDHQSSFSFPYRHGCEDILDKKIIDDAFFFDLKSFVLQDSIAILGGNDNDDYCHYLLSGNGTTDINIPLGRDSGDVLFSRKDEKENFWTVYNSVTGSKVRFSFESPSNMIVNATKTSTPELVDLKITDYCPFNCKFCYQGSTTKGAHAHILTTEYGRESVAKVLARLGVFEVAIGGGEPTLHPNFVEILRAFRKFNITPNFTTRSIGWLKGPDATEILNLCGQFAFSIDNENIRDINKIHGVLDFLGEEYPPYTNKCTIQIIDQVISRTYFLEVLKVCSKLYLPLTILGFKEDERGAEWAACNKKQDYKWYDLVGEFRENNPYTPRISVDTVLIERDGSILNDLGVSKLFMTPEEGKFSMYWNLVDEYISRSSYGDNEKVSIPNSKISNWDRSTDDTIRTKFQEW